MLDLHSHFLPKMDDGSKSTEMSMEMLRSSRKQGVTTIVSTSHFYGTEESPEQFLHRRQHAVDKLLPLLTDDHPEIYLGAEVFYYPGISHSESIPQLIIQGTDLLLIEMPFVTWSDRIFDELISMQYHYDQLRLPRMKKRFDVLFILAMTLIIDNKKPPVFDTETQKA